MSEPSWLILKLLMSVAELEPSAPVVEPADALAAEPEGIPAAPATNRNCAPAPIFGTCAEAVGTGVGVGVRPGVGVGVMPGVGVGVASETIRRGEITHPDIAEKREARTM